MTNTRKGRCVLCSHELIMCGDCASKVCSHPRCPNALCECYEERTASRGHYHFNFRDTTPESLAKALLRQQPKDTATISSEDGTKRFRMAT